MRRLPLACLLLAGAALAAPVPASKEAAAFRGGEWGRPIDPDKDCKFTFAKGALTVGAPGKDHDYERPGDNAPRVLRPVRGDFAAEVRVRGECRPPRGAHP